MKNKFSLIFLLFTLLLPQNRIYKLSSINNSLSFGRDSNVMRFSNNEINKMDGTPYFLPPGNISTRFLKYSTKIKIYSTKAFLSYIFGNKTNYSINANYTLNLDHNKKSNKNFSFKIDQHLGDYKHLYFGYFRMPDFYLREYEDLDVSEILYQIDNNNTFSFDCFNQYCEEYANYLEEYEDYIYSIVYSSAIFDLERLSLAYQFPFKKKYSRLKLGVGYEKQLYNEQFTEYDLKIKIRFAEFSYNANKHKVLIYYDGKNADNFTYQDGLFSTAFMDRSYRENRVKFSISESFSRKESYGVIADIYHRKNSSIAEDDKLHYLRKHKDATISIWYKINNHKFMISHRTRSTSSPYQWVESLKTFKRYIITYTFTFNKMKFN